MPGNYFFVDIDGTIVSTDYKLDSKVKKIINNEKDIKIVLVTGRLAASIQSLELKVDAICSNGSEIVYVNGETKRIACFTYDRVDEICNLIDKKNISYVLATEQGNIINENCNIIETVVDLSYLHGGDSETVIKGINIYYDIIYQKSIRVKDPRKYIRENNLTVSKIELFTAQNKDELKSLCENNIVGIQAFSSHISNLEIVPSGISKVQGIKFYLGDAFKDSDIFAIGDEKNDIDMLKLARHSFAVRNACKEVLDIVDTVVDSVDNCGFLQAHSIIKSWYLKLQNT